MRRSRFLGLAFAVVIVVGASDGARAICSFPSAADTFQSLFDRANVPTNLALVAPIGLPDGDTLLATPAAGGDSVVFTAQIVDGISQLRADEELQANTDYTLCLSNNCIAFQTADGPKTDAPPAPTASVTDVHGFTALDTECGGATNVTVVVIEGDADADVAAVSLTRDVGGARTLVRVQPLDANRRTIGIVDHTSDGGEASYELVGFDLAGNASEPTVLDQSLGCPGSCSQATTPTFAVFGLVLLAMRRRNRQHVARRVVS